MKKVAVIGSGISGTSAAYYLNKLGYDVYLFESGSYFGGHTNTIDIDFEGQRVSVDTGFLVLSLFQPTGERFLKILHQWILNQSDISD